MNRSAATDQSVAGRGVSAATQSQEQRQTRNDVRKRETGPNPRHDSPLFAPLAAPGELLARTLYDQPAGRSVSSFTPPARAASTELLHKLVSI